MTIYCLFCAKNTTRYMRNVSDMIFFGLDGNPKDYLKNNLGGVAHEKI